MVDIESATTGLKTAIGLTAERGGKIVSLRIEHADAILALLEELESVVHPEPSCEMTYITDCCCDLCGVQLIREDNFCRCCGKRIEWKSGEVNGS